MIFLNFIKNYITSRSKALVLHKAIFLFIGLMAVASSQGVGFKEISLGVSSTDPNLLIIPKGNVRHEKIATEMGSIQKTYEAHTIAGKGSAIEFQIKLPFRVETAAQDKNSNWLMMEVEEIHQRRKQVFGYTVLVNGQEVYFRSYEEMGAGPNHYFVPIPKENLTSSSIKVTFRNEGEESFSLARVWLYEDFFTLAQEEGVTKKMSVIEEAFILRNQDDKQKNNKTISWAERIKKPEIRQDIDYWKEMEDRFSKTVFSQGFMLDIPYAIRSQSEIEKIIDQYFERLSQYHLPLESQINFSAGEWGTHPNGPDGLGGYFSDVKYSKIAFDAQTQSYRTTWLNTPGSTTWPSFNNPQLMLYLKHRLDQAVRYFVDRRDLYKANGKSFPIPLIDHDWGISVEKDCNDFTMQAAEKNGLKLTPEDGYNEEEKIWLYRNIVQVPKRTAERFFKSVGRNPIIIDKGSIQLPQEQAFDQNYFHVWADPVDPFFDNAWAGYQHGMSENSWTTGELLPGLPEPYYEYMAAQGKVACSNLERACLPNWDYLQILYERGFQSVTLINTRWGEGDLFLPQGETLDQKVARPVVHADPFLFDRQFRRDSDLGSKEVLFSQENVERSVSDNHNPELMRPIDRNISSSVVYHLKQDRPFNSSLDLTLTVNMPNKSSIDVMVGLTPESLKMVKKISKKDLFRENGHPWKTWTTVSLGNDFKEGTEVYLKLVLNAQNEEKFGIEKLRVTIPWGKTSGPLGEISTNVYQKRIMSLWIQERAVLERLQRRYLDLSGSDPAFQEANSLISQGKYRSAYRHLSGEISQKLPARFAIRGFGKLGFYPISIQLPDEKEVAVIDLLKVGSGGVEFLLKTEKESLCKFHVEGLKSGQTYLLTSFPMNRYQLLPSTEKTAILAKEGKLDFEIKGIPQEKERVKLPSQFSGLCIDRNPSGITIETQDPRLWLENPIFVPINKETKLSRSQKGGSVIASSLPERWDQVDLLVNDSGIAEAIVSLSGKESGKIKSFTPAVVKGKTHNGIIELESGNRYEFSCMWGRTKIDVPPLNEFIRINSEKQLMAALAPGTEVDIVYSPYAVNGTLPRMVSLSQKKVQSK